VPEKEKTTTTEDVLIWCMAKRLSKEEGTQEWEGGLRGKNKGGEVF